MGKISWHCLCRYLLLPVFIFICLLWTCLLWQSGNPLVLVLSSGILLVGLFASCAWSLPDQPVRKEAALRMLNVGCGTILMLFMQQNFLLLFTLMGVTTSFLQVLNWSMAVGVFFVSLLAA